MDSAAISQPRTALTLHPWLVLGRISNLPTVWSNCLAGCWLGGWNTPVAVLSLCLGSTLLYIGGMFLNDVCDVRFDAQFRPQRPIVSGALNRRTVIIATALLFIVGNLLITEINTRSGLFALGLTILIIVYDWTHKHIRTAPFLMAGCRFLLYLTAAAAGLAGITPRSFFFAFLLGMYVAGLSLIARSESGAASPPRNLSLLLLFTPVVGALAINPAVMTIVLALPLISCLAWAIIVRRENIGHAVALLLAGIVLVDLLAISTGSPLMIANCIVLFAATLLFQKYIPAT